MFAEVDSETVLPALKLAQALVAGLLEQPLHLGLEFLTKLLEEDVAFTELGVKGGDAIYEVLSEGLQLRLVKFEGEVSGYVLDVLEGGLGSELVTHRR